MNCSPKYTYKDYIAFDRLPHLWCSGCGHGLILKSVALSLSDAQLPPDQVVIATGIGCSGRSGDYVTTHKFQGTHGRTLAFATGIKLSKPELTVVCIMGDGDCGAIGGNHLLHAARRDLDVVAIVSNNLNYGMTGGQFSPLTPENSITSTSRGGKQEKNMDICEIVRAAGATMVARTTVYHITQLRKMLHTALNTKGFTLIEVLTPCPTYYGRYNKLGAAADMMKWLRKKVIPLKQYNKLSAEEKREYYWRGTLVKNEVSASE